MLMNKMQWTVFSIVSILFVSAGHTAAPNMREGLWEVTAVVEGRSSPPTSLMHCISHKDTHDIPKMISGGEGAGCEVRDHKTQGNVVSWNMACTGKTKMTGSGSITFSETSHTGRSTLSVNRDGKIVPMTVLYTGKYLGPCKK
jgi:uncharacterized protein DUF3617